MRRPVTRRRQPPNIKRIVQNTFINGYQSTLSDDRKSPQSLKTTVNAYLNQDGTVRPVPSPVLYGTQPPGTVLGRVGTFVRTNGTANPDKCEIAVCVVGGVASAYVRLTGGTWQICTGKTFNTTARCYFEQVSNKVLILNGADTLSWFDITTYGTTYTIVPMSSIAAPTGAAIASSGSTSLSGSNFPWRLQVTAANGGGETAGSTAGTLTLTKTRSTWAGGTTEYLTYTWNRVTGATRYYIYVGDSAGAMYYLDTVTDVGSGATQSYVDNGSVPLNTNRRAPTFDSTGGMRCTRATNVLGQVHLDGDIDNPSRHWFGGFGDSATDFSPLNGGGWVDIDKGGKFFPTISKGFRTGKGDPAVTIWMKGTSGRGKLVHGVISTIQEGSYVITYLSLQEANGQDGTDGPDAVVYALDSWWYLSRSGPKTSGTAANKQNIISTQPFGDAIYNDVKALNVQSMDYSCGLEVDGRLWYALPVGSSTNNQLWICDLKRQQAWTLPVLLNVDWMWLADDANGVTHHCALIGNQIYEFSYSKLTTNASGAALPITIGSGIMKFSDDGMMWGSVIDLTFVMLNWQGGPVTFSVTGATEGGGAAKVIASKSFTPSFSMTGWNEAEWNNYLYPYNAVVNIPTSYTQSRVPITIEVDQELNWYSWEINGNSTGIDFDLSRVIARYVDIGVIEQ